VLRFGLAIFGLGLVLASPVLAAKHSRYAMIVELPWSAGEAERIGRLAGGLLLQSGWHSVVFYFPEGAAMPGMSSTTATIPVTGNIMACSRAEPR
jgi:hypothetical protein